MMGALEHFNWKQLPALSGNKGNGETKPKAVECKTNEHNGKFCKSALKHAKNLCRAAELGDKCLWVHD